MSEQRREQSGLSIVVILAQSWLFQLSPMAEGWEGACDVLNTALVTDAEVSDALECCLGLDAAHVPCESSAHVRLSAALRKLIQYHSDERIHNQAGRVLIALGPVTGGIARIIKSGDARAFDSKDARQAAYSFAIPDQAAPTDKKAASSGNTAVQAGSACNDTVSVGRLVQEQVQAEVLSKGKMVLEPTMGSGSRCLHLDPDMERCLDARESVDFSGRRSKKRKAAELWEPGQDTRGWIGRGGKHLEPQTQVLLVNQTSAKVEFPVAA